MNWFSKLFSKKQMGSSVTTFNMGMGSATQMRLDPDSISREAYNKLVVAFRCVNVIANAAASVKFNLFSGDKEIEEHAVLDLLKRPNPMQGGFQFLSECVSYFAIHGNCFIEGLSAGPQRPPVELRCHRTSRFSIRPGANFIPSAYVMRFGGGKEVTFPVDIMGRSAILHLKTFNPLDDYWGQSPINPAALDVDTLNSASMWNLSLLQNSARPCGIFFYTGEGNLKDEQRRQLRKDIDDMWKGAVNAGKPLLLGGKMDFKEAGFNPKDMDFLNSKKVSKTDIALAFGVPGQLVGISESQTFANYEQAVLSFYLETVLPITKIFCTELNHWLLPSYGENLELRPDEDSIMALEPMRKVQWDKALSATWLTPNEKRSLTGYAPYEGGEDPADKLYIQSSQVPIDVEDESFEELPVDEEPEELDEEGEKNFNVNTRRGKVQFWREQNRKRDILVKRLQSQLSAKFKLEKKEVLSAIDGITSMEMLEATVKEAISQNAKSFEPILRASIQKTMEVFGFATIRSLNQKAAGDKLESSIRLFIEREVGSKITRLSATSRKRVIKKVRDAVLVAESEGQSITLAAKAIEEAYSEFSKSRSLRIARTEIHNASMHASEAAAKATGVPNLQKEWVANLDSRVRDSHASMDGERVGLDEKFSVPSEDGPDMMNGPGDISAPADQVINCRCVLIYSQSE